MQDKSQLGTRYTCFQDGTKFYDLNRPAAICPSCGADQKDDPNPDPREAVLARFRGKGKPSRLDEEEEEELDEDAEVDDADADDDDDDDAADEPAGDEDE
jgi:uncharacterized protein (TIGR02300 family)